MVVNVENLIKKNVLLVYWYWLVIARFRVDSEGFQRVLQLRFIITVTGRIGFTGVFDKCPLSGFHDNDDVPLRDTKSVYSAHVRTTNAIVSETIVRKLVTVYNANTSRKIFSERAVFSKKPLITRRCKYRKSLCARLRREQIVRCAGWWVSFRIQVVNDIQSVVSISNTDADGY